ncbi:MAG TPA: CARDB domain-containing protein, partial [Chloroflexota bacterium]|nr:CARDB domain-containing protein [Chloroflexota bacterium]
MERLEDRALLATDVWTGAVSANWSNAANWSLGQLPGTTDTAEFQHGRTTATVDTSFTIGALQIDSSWGGTLTVSNSLSVSGNLTLASGTLSVGAPMSIAGPASSWTAGALNLVAGQALTNTGNFTIDPGAGGLTISGSGTLSNAGTLTDGGSGGLTISGGGTLSNAGTFTYGSAGTLTISTPFVNQGGTIDVASGTLSIASTNCTWSGGNLEAAGGATLQLAPSGGVGIILNGTYTGSGAGQVQLTGGTLVIGASGATFDFPQGLFQWQGGAITLNQGGTLTNTGFLTLANTGGIALNVATDTVINKGTVDQTGSGTVAINGQTFDNQAGGFYDISGTGVLSGSATFSDEGTLTMTGSGTGTLSVSSDLNGGTIDVASGTLLIQSTNCTWSGGNLEVAAGATLQLAPSGGNGIILTGTYTGSGGGQVQLTGGTLVIGASGATFDFPQGLFHWTGGTLSQGTLTNASGGFIDVDPSNNGSLTLNTPALALGGTIDVESGTLLLDVSTVTGSNGSFAVAQGATVDLTHFSPTYTGTFTGSGAGTVAIQGGTLNPGQGGVTFNFPAGLFQWTGGNINTALGDVTNKGVMTIAGPSNHLIVNDGTLDNFGTIIQTGSGSLDLHSDNKFPTTLKIEPGASYLIEADSGVSNAGGGQTAIDNAGTIEKTAGSGTSIIQADGTLTNTGTIEADSGIISLSATIAQVSSNTLTGGTWNALGGSTIQFPTGTSLTTNQASVTLSGAGASIPALANLATNAGTFSVLGGATFTTAGNLSNTGTLTIGPASTLTVKGNSSEGSAAMLNLEFGGTPASGQFGQLAVTGSAALGGTVNSEFVSGYAPTVGDTFKIISFASATGGFAATNSPVFRGGNVFQFQTSATSITFTAATSVSLLGVTSVSASPSSVQDGQSLTVNYSVQNTGNATSASAWVDSVFLSSGPAINASSVLLGQVTHTGKVAAGGTYPGTLKAAVPALAPGNYFIVVEVDSQGFVAESNRASNVLATTSAVQVTVPTLALAAAGGTPTPATGTLAAGQSPTFELQVPAGQTVQITASFNSANAGELLVGYRAVPTQAANLEQAFVPGQSQQHVTLTNTQQGTYFVVLLGQAGAGSGSPFVLTAQEQPFGIDSFSPTTGSNSGAVTLTLTGTLFTPATTVSLVAPGGTATTAIGVTFQNSTTLEAAFNLSALSPGAYHLKVQNGTQSSTATAPFTVTTASPGQLALHLSVPSVFRPG